MSNEEVGELFFDVEDFNFFDFEEDKSKTQKKVVAADHGVSEKSPKQSTLRLLNSNDDETVSPSIIDGAKNSKPKEIKLGETSVPSTDNDYVTWGDLHLNRLLIKSVLSLGWSKPTPIQKQAIPLVLEGHDILGQAETGSGKTGAFILPMLERLLHCQYIRQRRRLVNGTYSGSKGTTKCLILSPTRELAFQTYKVLLSLSKNTYITSAFVAGGVDQRAQINTLMHSPDFIVSTPGRILDLLLNAQSISVDYLEVIVFDEADRLLDMGFRNECLAIVKLCVNHCQALLFSATLSDKLEDFSLLTLKKPIRVASNASHMCVQSLSQEFLLVPLPKREESVCDNVKLDGKSQIKKEPKKKSTNGKINRKNLKSDFNSKRISDRAKWIKLHREAVVMHLCSQAPSQRTIVFFETKADTHRVSLLFKAFDIPHAEMHGDLNQTERVKSLGRFATNDVQYLLCTEIASRGIDIADVNVVINFEIPSDLTRHVHRVGRTARNGRSGTAVTLFVKEEKRKVLQLFKSSSSEKKVSKQFYNEVEWENVSHWVEKIKAIDSQLKKQIKIDIRDREIMQIEKKFAETETIDKTSPKLRRWIN